MANPSSESFTVTDLMAAASKALLDGGYHQVARRFEEWDTSTSRLFEDSYNIVGIVIFDTCSELLQSWPDLQGSLVEVISQHVGREESKAWDGYLVLLSLGLASFDSAAIDGVRYNTTRLRKLVATGDDLRNPTDVECVLRALLPLEEERADLDQQSALDLLPKLLADRGIERATTQIIVDAFREQAPLLERLHQKGEEQ
jgi:hypothetical protein